MNKFTIFAFGGPIIFTFVAVEVSCDCTNPFGGSKGYVRYSRCESVWTGIA